MANEKKSDTYSAIIDAARNAAEAHAFIDATRYACAVALSAADAEVVKCNYGDADDAEARAIVVSACTVSRADVAVRAAADACAYAYDACAKARAAAADVAYAKAVNEAVAVKAKADERLLKKAKRAAKAAALWAKERGIEIES